jgi:hypothetical protein
MKPILWKSIEIYVHHISYQSNEYGRDPVVKYILVGKSKEKVGLFKIQVTDLELNNKKLETYLLGQVERSS